MNYILRLIGTSIGVAGVSMGAAMSTLYPQQSQWVLLDVLGGLVCGFSAVFGRSS